MKTTIALLQPSSTRTRRPLTATHPSFTPFHTVYASTAMLEMLVKPMKNEEIQKTHKMSDAILTSSNKNDDKTHFINEAAKKCIFHSMPCTKKRSFFENVLPAQARNTFWQPEMHLSCHPKALDLPSCMPYLANQKVYLIELALLWLLLFVKSSILLRDFYHFLKSAVWRNCRTTPHAYSDRKHCSSIISRKSRPHSSHSDFFTPTWCSKITC